MPDVPQKVAFINPFPGLRSFERADAYLFFGRDNQIQNLKAKLLDAQFLAIIGSSGSGKSSLVKAGLVPQLVDGPPTTARFTRWQLVFFNPEATPFQNFAHALYNSLSEQSQSFATQFSPQSVEDLIRTDADAVIGLCQNANLLLIIDQFEELFRYQPAQTVAEDISDFINLVIRLSRRPDSSVYIILTMRSDYLDQCTNYEGLTEAINHGYYLLPKMNRDEIRQAIVKPVGVMGAQITDALIVRLLSDIGTSTDQLPIMQHALMRTWTHWQTNRQIGHPIDLSDYEAIGTMQRAITLHAEEVYADLPDEKSQRAIEQLFKALIVLNENGGGLVRPTSVGTISEVAGMPTDLLIEVLNRFREPDVAFLTPPPAVFASREVLIDVSNERIINLWERLHTWVKEEIESAKFYRQVSQSAMRYQQGQVGLWTNPELQIGQKWLAENHPTQAWANRYDLYLERATNFLEYSRQQYDLEIQNKEDRQRKELKRARSFAFFVGIGGLLALLLLVVSVVLRTQAQQSEAQAMDEKQKALIQRNLAQDQTREAVTQKKIAEQQEIITDQQKRLTYEQRNIAVAEKKNAESQKKMAEQAQRSAEKQKDLARAAQAAAERQKQLAERAQRNAEIQKDLAQTAQAMAESQKRIAEQAKSYAEQAKSYAEQQRSKAIARSIAVQSFQMTETTGDDLAGLLALEAYTLNVKNGGEPDNPDIFNALAKAADAQVTLRGHTDMVRALDLSSSADDQLIASASDDGTVKLRAIDNPNPVIESLRLPDRTIDGIRAVVFDQRAETVFGGSESGKIYAWKISPPGKTTKPDKAPKPDRKAVSINAHTGPVLTLLTTADRGMVISVGADGHIRIWKPVDSGLDSIQNIRTELPLYCARLSADNKRLVCGSSGGRLLSFDLTKLTNPPGIFTRRELGNRITALAFSPDGNLLVTGNPAGLVFAWGLKNNEPDETGRLLASRHSSTVNTIVFSPNGNLLATGSADWSVHLWTVGTLSQQHPPIVINDFDGWVLALRFSRDSKYLIACGADKTVRIRDIDTADLYAGLTKKITRNLTPEEWAKYIGKDIPYEKNKLGR